MPNELMNNPFNIYDGSLYFPYTDCRYVLKSDINLPAKSLQELLKRVFSFFGMIQKIEITK